jgi:hypothetical protein
VASGPPVLGPLLSRRTGHTHRGFGFLCGGTCDGEGNPDKADNPNDVFSFVALSAGASFFNLRSGVGLALIRKACSFLMGALIASFGSGCWRLERLKGRTF